MKYVFELKFQARTMFFVISKFCIHLKKVKFQNCYCHFQNLNLQFINLLSFLLFLCSEIAFLFFVFVTVKPTEETAMPTLLPTPVPSGDPTASPTYSPTGMDNTVKQNLLRMKKKTINLLLFFMFLCNQNA